MLPTLPKWTTRERIDILALCDCIDETIGDPTGLTRLTRLQHWCGDDQSNTEAQTIIRMLQKECNIIPKQTKGVRLSHEKYLEIRRFTRSRANAIDTYHYYLEIPFGAYYEKLTVPFILLDAKELVDDWMENPIVDVTITNIPGQCTALDIRSERLSRCWRVGLHFNETDKPFSYILNMLKGMNLANVRVIEIRGVRVSEAMAKATLIQLKPFFRLLEKIE